MSDEITEDIILDEEPEVSESSDIDFPDKLIKVRFVHSNESAMCAYPDDFDVKDKDYAIVDGKYGKDLAQVKGGIYLVSERGKPKHVRDVYTIIRKATDADMKRYETNCEREKEAFRICAQKIADHKLEMKLVSAH
ncbi:MAG: hypothetical protein IKT97_01925, partial [Spirochaetia bacterium]|nr:hypothetical protein [Spirochaetia bacterium]